MDPVRVAIVGSGWGHRVQIPCFRAAGWSVVCLVGRDLQKTKKVAEEHNIPHAVDRIEDALTLPEVDIVSVVTPPHTHLSHAEKVLAAGKHLLTEKPFALDRHEARRIMAAHAASCQKLNRRLIALTDHELRFHRVVPRIRSWILSGAFGNIHTASLEFFAGMRAVTSQQWSWWNDASKGGGVLGAIGSHLVDLICFLTATETQCVSASIRTVVTTKEDENGQPKQVTSDDTVDMRMKQRTIQEEEMNNSYRAPHTPGTLQEFEARITLNAASFGFTRSAVYLLSDRGALTFDMDTLDATFTPAAVATGAGKEDESKHQVESFKNEIPKEVTDEIRQMRMGLYADGTVMLAQAVGKAIAELKELDAADASASSSSSSSSSSDASLTQHPPSLSGLGATLHDGSFVQCVLDAARESSQHESRWIQVDKP